MGSGVAVGGAGVGARVGGIAAGEGRGVAVGAVVGADGMIVGSSAVTPPASGDTSADWREAVAAGAGRPPQPASTIAAITTIAAISAKGQTCLVFRFNIQ